MARTDGPLRAARQHYADRNSHFNEETPLGSDPGGDPLDELIAGLTPTFDVELAKPASAGFSSVEDLHYEDSAARNMASRLAPNPNPRPKIRRSRLRRAARDSLRFPYEQAEREEQNGGLLEDRWSPPRSTEVPRRRGRTMFWRISAGLLIAASVFAVYGLVKPLNDLPPNRTGDIAGNPAANLPDGGVTSAEIKAAGSSVGSDPGAPGTERQVATIAVRRVTTIPVTRAAAALSAPPPVAQAGSGSDEQARSQAVAGREILDPGATGLQSGTTASTVGDDTLPGSRSAPVEKTEDRLFEPALQRSAQADSAPTTGSLGEPVSGEAQPVEPRQVDPQLSAEQIDRLLARGKELLENGNIAAARLMFTRVAAAGDPRGAMGVGMTYDPDVYVRLSVTGIAPDREQAQFWYEKAGEVPKFTIVGKTVSATPVTPITPATPETQDVTSSERNAACARKYNSFDPSTGLYTSYSGVKRPCRLP